MNTRDEFWKHVNAALDDRRDPLEDESVQRLVSESPELLRDLHRLERGVELAARERPGRSLLLPLAAALFVASLATWLAAGEPTRVHRVDDANAQLALREQALSRVLDYELSVSRVDEHGTETITCDGVGRSRTLIARDGSVVRNTIRLANDKTRNHQP